MVTFYCPCKKCCGKNSPEAGGHGLTASGVKPKVGLTVAADWKVWPKGTCLEIEGVGFRKVQDKGGDIKGQTLDVFLGSHEEARHKAVKVRRVRIAPGRC